ncbi:MAG: hypothetical protein KC713_06225 [Candidatus Omnitrophica bacterium]|nr:hypothetical protein [Candidatus Omnitrophota bacterium]
MKNTKIKDSAGLTFVEITIVAAIIMLLAAILIPNINKNRIIANETSAQASLKSISTAFENYVTANHVYPTDTDDLLTANPPYIYLDYFNSHVHNGYIFSATLSNSTYSVVATPTGPNQGIKSFTITTGGFLSENP